MTDTTTFFQNGRAVMWYAVVNGKMEFFTHPWIHPVSKKILKPVTPYIAEMYPVEGQNTCEEE